MFLDDEMLKKILRSYNYSEEYIANFNEEIKNLFFELVIAHVLNYYASQNSQNEIDQLEKLMKDIRIKGNYEDQTKLTNIIKDTILKYPDLTDQLMEIQRDLLKNLLMSFLQNSNEQSQIDIFSYLIEMKSKVKENREILNKIQPTAK